jgi:hypothetical protein
VETVAVSTKGVAAVVLTEEAAVMVVLIEEVLTGVQGRCIKRFVPNAIKNVKFLLNQQKANQYIAENVFRNANIN